MGRCAFENRQWSTHVVRLLGNRHYIISLEASLTDNVFVERMSHLSFQLSLLSDCLVLKITNLAPKTAFKRLFIIIIKIYFHETNS